VQVSSFEPSRPPKTEKATRSAAPPIISTSRPHSGTPRFIPLSAVGTNSTLTIPAYELAQVRIITNGKELHEVPVATLARWVSQIVRTESPVHTTEVARRITEAAGVKQMESRIEEAIRLGCTYAVQLGEVHQRGDFLWINPNQPPRVRGRSSLPEAARKLELIAPEEIDQAIEAVVAAAKGLEQSLIPSAVCELLGFGKMTDEMQERIEYRLKAMVRAGRLAAQGTNLVVNTDNIPPR
jgi:hypothetical protein